MTMSIEPMIATMSATMQPFEISGSMLMLWKLGARAFNEGKTLTLGDVAAQALALGDRLVEITGGEPLLQPEVHPLMTQLADAGRTVLLETSGAIATTTVE